MWLRGCYTRLMNRAKIYTTALAEAQSALEAAENESAEAKIKVERLRKEVAGLRRALSAYGHDDEPSSVLVKSSLPQDASKWRSLTRTAAIERMFQEQDSDLHRKRLTTLLVERGRNDQIRDVSAALAYLKRVGRVSPLGDGYWRLTTNGKVKGGGE